MVEQANQTSKEEYNQQGYVIFPKVLDQDLIEEARRHVDWLLQKHPDLRPEQLGNNLMTRDAFWVRLIRDDRLLDIAEQFIGPNIALHASHYIAKPPYTGQEVLWHQDGSFWPLEPMEVITLWLALDRSDTENGCLRVIPGTQSMRLLSLEEMEDRENGMNVLGKGIDPRTLDESQANDLILEPGDVSIHHPNVIHGSHANASPRWRRGLTIRYIPTTTRILKPQPHVSAFMLRGEPVAGVNLYNPWPEYVQGEHMPFKDALEWNTRCRAANQRYRLVLPEGQQT
jgi:ectoine hydroxylase-related dioxygenase (phytanoyl-CoA dioxygenase family)